MHATSPFARRQRLAFLPVVVGVLGGTANADENAPGPGNVLAMEIAGRSALVRSAKAFIDQHIGEIRDDKLRAVTADAIVNPATYIRPNIWHGAVVPIDDHARLLDRQGRVHARISVDFAKEFGCYLAVPMRL